MKLNSIKYKYLIIIILINGLSCKLYSQKQDFGLWTGIEVENKLSKRFDLAMELGNRWKDNLAQRDESFASVGISWSKKAWSFATNYRFANEKNKDNYNLAHRFYLQGKYDFEFNRFSLSNRSRIQMQYKNINRSENGKLPESLFRNRLSLDYNIKGIPLKPEISYEFFYKINNYATKQIEKSRFILGLGYKINKDNQVGLSFITQKTVNQPNPSKKYILGIDYKLEI